MADDLPIDERLTIPGADLSYSAVRSSGPGGQHVNTSSTKVLLRFDVDGCAALAGPIKARLIKLAARHVDADGGIVIASQATRSQARNLDDARARLVALIRRALAPPPPPRKKTKPSRRARQRRLTAKRQHAEKKRGRARPGPGDD